MVVSPEDRTVAARSRRCTWYRRRPRGARYRGEMPLLYHWTRENYRADLQGGVAWHLNQKNGRLREIDRGDSVWAFTRNTVGAYVLAAEVVVRAKTVNAPGFPYGPYRVWADVPRSRFFHVDSQVSTELVLRALSIRPTARILGQGFQGLAAVQTITGADHAMLAEASRGLALEPRSIEPAEEALEAALRAPNPAHLHLLLPREVGPTRRWERLVRGFARSARLVGELRALYAGRCQICEWSSNEDYGTELCEAHHWHWLSRGGADDLRNLVLLCPNHHRAVHGCDALLDFETSAPVFDFGDGRRERVRLDRHLAVRLA